MRKGYDKDTPAKAKVVRIRKRKIRVVQNDKQERSSTIRSRISALLPVLVARTRPLHYTVHTKYEYGTLLKPTFLLMDD
jgi:hypothetical protein